MKKSISITLITMLFGLLITMEFPVFAASSGLSDTTGIKEYEVKISSSDVISSTAKFDTIIGTSDSVFILQNYYPANGWVTSITYSGITAAKDSNVTTVYLTPKYSNSVKYFTVTLDSLKKSGGNLIIPFANYPAQMYDLYAKNTKIIATDTVYLNRISIAKRRNRLK